MKYLKTAPKKQEFFEIYARLSKQINLSGKAAQVVSALTEVGGIYAASYLGLKPIMSDRLAIVLSVIVAVIGTAVIEGGLRGLLPKGIDAILYRRWTGLHLPMSIAIFVMVTVLMLASGYLSFTNSKKLVKQYTPEAELLVTVSADSALAAKKAELSTTYQQDTAQINAQFGEQLSAAALLAQNEEGAAQRELSNWYNREQRSGQSYGTRKDQARQRLANVKAEGAARLAELKAAQSAALSAAKTNYDSRLAIAEAQHQEATQEIKAENAGLLADRDQTIAQYGGGLGWFTIICLLVFTASVILERIHRKGSGIEDKVELSQYDLNPSIWTEAIGALRERINYWMYERIVGFQERTPAAPVPQPAAALYDPSQLANLNVTIEIKKTEDDDPKVIQVEPKRRPIGFHRTVEDTDVSCTPTHEISCAIKGTRKNTGESLEIKQIKQRLKDYKKRLGKHEQKAIVQKRNKGEVNKRTAQAIANNEEWVKTYEQKLQQALAAYQDTSK